MTTNNPPARDEQWTAGERATFHYSLAPDPTSEISARLAHRSGQVVTITARENDDADFDTMPTYKERAEAGALAVYGVQFPDGHTDGAFEDELFPLSY